MPPTIPSRQLPLPLAIPVPLAVRCPPPPATAPPLVWVSLSPSERTQIRQTLVTLLQEVLYVADVP